MNFLDSPLGKLPIIDCSNHEPEAYIGLYGSQERPYKLTVDSGNANFHVGDYKSAGEALQASLDFGAQVCYWFIRGKR